MTQEAFASHLGVSRRAVAEWSSRPEMKPSKDYQEVLDVALERAPGAARQRFESISQIGMAWTGAEALTVAIAIVIHEDAVLLVCRRGDDGKGIAWQFPAGVVKPGALSSTVAVRETLSETGVHCAVSRSLGARLHPVTSVYCEYFLCEYLAGVAENNDMIENVSVTWVPITKLAKFVPADTIHRPIIEALEKSHDRAAA
ncbi:8-oxo-dGTP diphosphatase [Allocatelliglobosispora scoriae]|uniref:8-oxo-dGTP diphosphatase n=1 Tax=Allocatelliglobosispora scoriae TaxID=643052 RepID=A0A841BHL7_9ACTN|nr:NUDIX domain-containing protein [Allocatelliglobosispora scoriae]MBB5866818.1 8-oxo-dGTP diphosphatase [Allocatelliglobosispora scoriae]